MTETIPRRLERLAAQASDKVFSVLYQRDRRHELTYGDAYRRARHFADRLAAAGVSPGETVAIMLRHSPELYCAFLGTMMAGAIPTLMPHPNPKQDEHYFWSSHRELFGITQIAALIVYPELIESATSAFGSTVHLLVPDDPSSSAGEPVERLPDSGYSDTALLQHSSGTTGLKKGVVLSHATILSHVDAYAAALGFTPADVVASWLPLYHDMGLITSFLMPLVTGAQVVALDPFDWVARPSKLLEVIAEHRATFCWLPNFAFRHLENTARPGENYDLSSIRALINCSEPCRVDTFDGFFARFSASGIAPEQLQVCYAMAENTFAITQTPLGSVPRRLFVDRNALERRGVVVETGTDSAAAAFLSCGTVIDGAQIRIVDENRAVLGEDLIGEVAVGGSYLFNGYFRRPELTAERMVGDWYYSGDLGFVHDGELYITGRKDDLLILYGRNIYAHEVEGCLGGCPGLVPGRAIALGVDNQRSGSRDLVVLAEVEEDIAAAEFQRVVKRRVFDRLGLSVARVSTVEKGWLAKSTSGKIARRLNLERYQEMIAAGREHL